MNTLVASVAVILLLTGQHPQMPAGMSHEEHLKQIVEIQLGRVRARLADRRITLTLTDAARADLVRSGYDPRYGARPLKRAIQKKIETPLGKLLLQGTVKDGQTVTVDAGDGGELTFKV